MTLPKSVMSATEFFISFARDSQLNRAAVPVAVYGLCGLAPAAIKQRIGRIENWLGLFLILSRCSFDMRKPGCRPRSAMKVFCVVTQRFQIGP
jgi:hypothetical protein